MRWLFVLGLVLFCAVASDRAWGQTCTTSATGVAFGTYQPLTGASATSTGTVTVTCNPGLVALLVSYTIQLAPGGSGSFAARSMSGPGSRLGYQLYRDALYTQVWGDGTAGTSTVTDGYLLGVVLPVTRRYTVYGRIPGSQGVRVGSYLDTITVLLTY